MKITLLLHSIHILQSQGSESAAISLFNLIGTPGNHQAEDQRAECTEHHQEELQGEILEGISNAKDEWHGKWGNTIADSKGLITEMTCQEMDRQNIWKENLILLNLNDSIKNILSYRGQMSHWQ